MRLVFDTIAIYVEIVLFFADTSIASGEIFRARPASFDNSAPEYSDKLCALQSKLSPLFNGTFDGKARVEISIVTF